MLRRDVNGGARQALRFQSPGGASHATVRGALEAMLSEGVFPRHVQAFSLDVAKELAAYFLKNCHMPGPSALGVLTRRIQNIEIDVSEDKISWWFKAGSYTRMFVGSTATPL